jgi:hypothetical protein
MFVRGFLIFIVLVFPFISLAQPGGGGDPGPGQPVPISGLEILLGVGALFGAKKILDQKKKNSVKN